MHPNPLEGMELSSDNWKAFDKHYFKSPHLYPFWGRWILWPLILVQNALSLYLLFMFASAIKNKVKQ